MHPWSACKKKHAAEPQVQADQPAFPAQWFYGLYVISPVTGLSCHRRLAIIVAKLSASVGAPGPYDFAVRDSVIRLLTRRVHHIPRPTFVTIAKRPSYRVRDRADDRSDLGFTAIPTACGTLARRAMRAFLQNSKQSLSCDVIPGRCASKSAVADLDKHLPNSGKPEVGYRTRNLEIPGLVLSHHPGMTAAIIVRSFP
jgi:hypothetical protein